MKRTIIMIFCLVMVLCLCACGGSKNDVVGTSYTAEDGVVTCGAMTEGPAFYVWANPAGFTATLNAEGTFTSDQEGLEAVSTDALDGMLEAASAEPAA